MGSPFYVENWIPPTLIVWLIAVLIGLLLRLSPLTRSVGASLVTGTLRGAGIFVLAFGVLVFIAPV
jgi:hypothetical protein